MALIAGEPVARGGWIAPPDSRAAAEVAGHGRTVSDRTCVRRVEMPSPPSRSRRNPERSSGVVVRSRRSRPSFRSDCFAIKTNPRRAAKSMNLTLPRSRITSEASPPIARRSSESSVLAFERPSSPNARTTSASPSGSTRTVSFPSSRTLPECRSPPPPHFSRLAPPPRKEERNGERPRQLQCSRAFPIVLECWVHSARRAKRLDTLTAYARRLSSGGLKALGDFAAPWRKWLRSGLQSRFTPVRFRLGASHESPRNHAVLSRRGAGARLARYCAGDVGEAG